MSTRILKSRVQPSTNKTPKTHHEWDNLMRKVIARAKEQQDRRLEGLQGVIPKGQSAKFLKKLGIICENDILREFPDRKM
jgi:hypothetical protein